MPRVKKTAKEKLDQVLDIANDELIDNGKEPISTDVTVITPTDVTAAVASAKEVQLAPEPPEDEAKEDLDYARAKLYTLIDKVSEGVDGILEVCNENGHPRSYEVLGQLAKVASEIVKDLTNLHKLKAELNKFKMLPSEPSVPESINPLDNPNASVTVFHGSTKDLLQAIKKGKEDPSEQQPSTKENK